MKFGEMPDDVPPEIKIKAEKYHNNVIDPLLRRGLSAFFKSQGTDLVKMREMIEQEDLTGTVDFMNRQFTGDEMLAARDHFYKLMYTTIVNFSMLQASNMISAILRGEEIESVDVETGECKMAKIEPLSPELLKSMGLPSMEDIANMAGTAGEEEDTSEDWKKGKQPDTPPSDGSKSHRFKPNNN